MKDNNKNKQPLFIKQLTELLPLEKYSHLIDLCCSTNSDASKSHMMKNNAVQSHAVKNHETKNHEADNLVWKALEFAYKHHAGQTRRSGEPYIIHPIAVAEIIAGTLGLKDPELLAATLLHDIVEDVSSLTIGSLERRFGRNVAKFVDGCTKLKMMGLDQNLNKDMTYQKLILMASENPEILLIKIADRIHNMQTIAFLKEHKRQRIAHETMEVYAPLAEKLGLFSVKRMLFEMAIRQRFPKKSKKLLNILNNIEQSGEIGEIKSRISQACRVFAFEIEVTGRLKNLYSFYSARTKTLDINTAENLVDFTITMNTVNELNCYHALGIINTLFSPVPKSIRDYIANPKVNGYKSLHVRIVYKDQRYLIKIRTAQMERVARKGLLLHWDDKDQIHEYRKMLMDILKSIAEYEGSPVTRKDMIRQLIEDDKVFVYTPQEEIHYLPEGSIVLDFAYQVHTTLGDRCQHAIVNNQKVTPAYVLNDGDRVEIFTSSHSSEISSDIEGKCKTPKARNTVNRKLQKKRNAYAEKIGRNIMFQAMEQHDLNDDLFQSSGFLDFLTYRRLENLEQFFTSIGQFRLNPREVLCDVAAITRGGFERFVLPFSSIERDIHKFSQCCKPLPGMGLCVGIPSVNGVSLHRSNCERYKERRGYSDEKIVVITWSMEVVWKKPLVFHLLVRWLSFSKAVQILAGISPAINIHTLRESKQGKGIVLKISLQSFEQSRSFFSCFENANYIVEIEDYGKKL